MIDDDDGGGDDDNLVQYARALVAGRIPELTVDELITALAGPDAALPVEIAAEVLDVLTAFEDKLDQLLATGSLVEP